MKHHISECEIRECNIFHMMNIQNKTILILILLGLVDILIPIPIIGLILIYVFIQKPSWFMDLVQKIYRLE
jgi:hypothetical protein